MLQEVCENMELKETKKVETVQAEYLAPDFGDHKQPEEAVVVRMLRPGDF